MSGNSAEKTAGIERRTVVRVGAWSVPVVAVAVAAPAHACSPENSLRFDGFTANYEFYLNASAVLPDRISVTSAVTNTGTTATGMYVRTLTIPGNLFDSVATSVPEGYLSAPAPTVVGSFEAGWTITYQRSAPLAPNETDNFAVILTVGSTATTAGTDLYRGWRGPGFILGGTVNGGSTCNTLSPSDLVEATGDTTLAIENFTATRTGASGSLTAGSTTTFVTNTGRKTAGPITVTIRVPIGGGRYSSASTTATASPGWTPSVGTQDATAYIYTFTSNGDYLAPFGLSGNGPQRSPYFEAQISLTGGQQGTPSNVSISMQASAANASPASTSDPA